MSCIQPRSQGFSLLKWTSKSTSFPGLFPFEMGRRDFFSRRPNSKGKSPGNEVDFEVHFKREKPWERGWSCILLCSSACLLGRLLSVLLYNVAPTLSQRCFMSLWMKSYSVTVQIELLSSRDFSVLWCCSFCCTRWSKRLNLSHES